MKTQTTPTSLALAAILAVSSLSLTAQSNTQTPAQQAEAFYRQGQAAEKSGNPEAARKAYTAALHAYPKHAHARYSLGQLKISSGTIAAKGREEKFGAVVVPEYKLDAASLTEALDALRQIVAKESKGEVAPNFIVQDPGNKLGEAKVTLVLSKVPAKGVLKYVLDQAGAQARFDEHAIVVTPR